jgi:hypothetical protein
MLRTRHSLIATALGQLPPGRHLAPWSGRTDRGTRVASGVYFVRVEAGEFHATKKLVVIR